MISSRPVFVVSADVFKAAQRRTESHLTMKRHLSVLLIAGLMAGGLALCSPKSEAGIFRRGGPFRGYGVYQAYGPGYGYGVYSHAGYGWGGYGMGYRNYGYGGYGYPAYGYSGYGYPGYMGYGLGGYPAVYGTSVSIGTSPYSGFYMSTYPY